MTNVTPLPSRHRAYLRAIADGRGEMTVSSEPDLYIDGLACCDQHTAHELAHTGLITPVRPAKPGKRAPAVLTETGTTALAA